MIRRARGTSRRCAVSATGFSNRPPTARRRRPGRPARARRRGTSDRRGLGMRDKLIWRLLGAQLLVIAIAVAISGALITDRAAQFFMVIMTRYHIDPTAVEQDFLREVPRVLIAGSIIAAAAAMLLGWILVRRLVRSISDMMLLAERIAAGDYAQRVATRGPDELVRLAESLNRMAASLERVES